MDEAESLLKECETARLEWLHSSRDTPQREAVYLEKRAAALAAMRKGVVPDREGMAQVLARTRVGFAQPAAVIYEAVDAMLAAAPQPPALDRDGIIEACAKLLEKLFSDDAGEYEAVSEAMSEAFNDGEDRSLSMSEKLRLHIGPAIAAIRAMKGE